MNATTTTTDFAAAIAAEEASRADQVAELAALQEQVKKLEWALQSSSHRLSGLRRAQRDQNEREREAAALAARATFKGTKVHFVDADVHAFCRSTQPKISYTIAAWWSLPYDERRALIETGALCGTCYGSYQKRTGSRR